MGSSTSKAARTANTALRKYPTRIPPQNFTNAPSDQPVAATSPGPTVHPQTQASESRNDAITRDASDPDLAFNARLSQLGPVQPSPTLSHSSTFNTSARLPTSPPRASPQSSSHTEQPSPSTSSSFQPSASAPSQSIFPSPASNPAITLLAARSRLAQEAEEQFENLGRKNSPGRSFLDVTTIRQILMMRDELRKAPEEIERVLGLKRGVVGKLGDKGVFIGAGSGPEGGLGG